MAPRAETRWQRLAPSPTPSLFGLAPCGVCPASRITARAVRSYRTFSPLPQQSNISGSGGLAPALPLRPAQKWIGFRSSLQSKGSATACACFTLASGSSRTALTVRSPGRRRYIFCGTFRKVSLNSPSRTLSGTLLCGVRTFLSLDRAARETPASTSQTATIRFDISYPYYKMNLGSKGLTPTVSALIG